MSVNCYFHNLVFASFFPPRVPSINVFFCFFFLWSSAEGTHAWMYYKDFWLVMKQSQYIILMALYTTTGDHLQKTFDYVWKNNCCACDLNDRLWFYKPVAVVRIWRTDKDTCICMYLYLIDSVYVDQMWKFFLPLSLSLGVFVSPMFPCTMCLGNKRKEPVSSVLWPTLKQQHQNKSGHDKTFPLLFFFFSYKHHFFPQPPLLRGTSISFSAVWASAPAVSNLSSTLPPTSVSTSLLLLCRLHLAIKRQFNNQNTTEVVVWGKRLTSFYGSGC